MTQIRAIVNTKMCHLLLCRRGDHMKTAEIIRGLREDKDVTQQFMAEFLDIGRTMYRRYETGETEIPLRHLKKLCQFFGVSADYLIGLPDGLRSRGNRKNKHIVQKAIEDLYEEIYETIQGSAERAADIDDLLDMIYYNIEDDKAKTLKKYGFLKTEPK